MASNAARKACYIHDKGTIRTLLKVLPYHALKLLKEKFKPYRNEFNKGIKDD